jgi:hypothetical protein
MLFEHRHDYTSREMPWPFDSDFGPDLNRSESRLAPRGLKSEMGLGRVKTQAPAACVEYLGGIAYRESLRTYGSTQRRRILFFICR